MYRLTLIALSHVFHCSHTFSHDKLCMCSQQEKSYDESYSTVLDEEEEERIETEAVLGATITSRPMFVRRRSIRNLHPFYITEVSSLLPAAAAYRRLVDFTVYRGQNRAPVGTA
jgi:hypothetical protein